MLAHARAKPRAQGQSQNLRRRGDQKQESDLVPKTKVVIHGNEQHCIGHSPSHTNQPVGSKEYLVRTIDEYGHQHLTYAVSIALDDGAHWYDP